VQCSALTRTQWRAAEHELDLTAPVPDPQRTSTEADKVATTATPPLDECFCQPGGVPPRKRLGDAAGRAQAVSAVPMPAPVASPRRQPSSTSAPAPASQPGGPWREWSPFQTTVSYKIPPELARELDERLHDLREPVGLTVVAAITHLLDQDDAAIGRLIDRAEQAKPRPGRRAGR